jgi:hypothetical protein
LAQLAIRPLDLVALAGTPLDSDSEIDRRIRVASGQPAATINYAADAALGPDAVTFPAVMELSRAIDRLISGARPLVASDLATASDSVTDVVDPDVAARAQAALAALIALDLSTPATQRQQLRAAAAFGFAGAYVTDDASVSDVATTAQRVDAERQVRIRQAGATSDPADIVRAVFGRRLPMVGQFTFPNTIPAALAGPQGLTQNDVRRWLQKAARVRPGLDRWRRVRLIAEALNAPPVKWEVAQLPYASSASWAAIPFNAGAAPASGTASIVLHRPGQTAPSPTWAGLLIEEWSELIPAAVQQTGIAFNYSSPRAEAPQAVLLAVPPVDSATWSTEVVADIVRETFELAQIRLLTPDLLKAFSLLLPATCLSVNTGGDALSTNLWTAVVSPIQVVAQGS